MHNLISLGLISLGLIPRGLPRFIEESLKTDGFHQIKLSSTKCLVGLPRGLFTNRWIIAKSIDIDEAESYWYIDKDFDTTWEYDDGGVFYNRIQKHVYDPFDKTTFDKELEEKKYKSEVRSIMLQKQIRTALRGGFLLRQFLCKVRL